MFEEKKMSSDDLIELYEKCVRKIDTMKSEREIIHVYQSLAGKSYQSEYLKIDDLGDRFIREFLERNHGKNKPYNYTKGGERFLQSKYLSEYFKSKINQLLMDNIILLLAKSKSSVDVFSLVKSNKMFNQMTEAEISAIVEAVEIVEKYSKNSKNNYNSNLLFSYLYHLNGEGAISYIKNHVSAVEFANQILATSGVHPVASYYSGRGVNLGDLSDSHLVSIFKKLLKYDVTYAYNFVELIQKMNILDATQFITCFKNFAQDGFCVKSNHISADSYSFEGIDPNYCYPYTYLMVECSSFTQNLKLQKEKSKLIKQAFLFEINPILQKVYSNYELVQGESYGQTYFRKISKK